jgi:protocatechuate 3,4-dioxygenase beta subunit
LDEETDGIYEKKGDETGWGRRHGYIRGWVKTDAQGKYTFHTFRPGAYPARDEPEHIHIIVKEPERNEYYIDDFLFDDDPLLTAERRAKQPNRGGSGIVKPVPMGDIFLVERNIFLGMNVPDCPEK